MGPWKTLGSVGFIPAKFHHYGSMKCVLIVKEVSHLRTWMHAILDLKGWSLERELVMFHWCRESQADFLDTSALPESQLGS